MQEQSSLQLFYNTIMGGTTGVCGYTMTHSLFKPADYTWGTTKIEVFPATLANNGYYNLS